MPVVNEEINKLKNMKPVSLLLMLFIGFYSTAQNVGIGTNAPDASAMLDVRSTTKGMLLPQVALTASNSAAPVAAPANGLLVYNTATGGTAPNDVTPGLYIWNTGSSSWNKVFSSQESLWSRMSDGAPATNFADDIYRVQRVSIGGPGAIANNARLQVDIGSSAFNLGFLVSGTFNNAAVVPNMGTGSRMFYYPGKAAFRAGTVTGSQWDDLLTGKYSAALGRNTIASGQSSFAGGDSSVASGDFSSAIGYKTKTSASRAIAMGDSAVASGASSVSIGFMTTSGGQWSTALGASTSATGTASTALGNSSIASGNSSTAIGVSTFATGAYSTAAGYGSVASGQYSTALGYVTTAAGLYSTSLGTGTIATGVSSTSTGSNTYAKAYGSFVLGRYNDSVATADPLNWNNNDPLLIVGNGSSDIARHNAMVLYKNGVLVLKNQTTVSVDAPAFVAPVNGEGTRMMWLPEKSAFRVGTVTDGRWDAASIGVYSFSAGRATLASNNAAIALGDSATATGFSSVAIGNRVIASNIYATAVGNGTTASGQNSTALGNGTIASGQNSTAMGTVTIASGTHSISTGQSTIASGQTSAAMNFNTRAIGTSSFATGSNSRAPGFISFSAGEATVSRPYASLAIGRYNDSVISSNQTTWIDTDPLLMLGNGTSDLARNNAMVVYKNGNTDIDGFTRLGDSTATVNVPRIKVKKIVGYNTPSSAAPNTWTFIPHGIANPAKILSMSVIVTSGSFQFLPHSPDAGYLFTVNTDPTGGGVGQSIAVGVKSLAQSGNVMNMPIKVFITYEE